MHAMIITINIKTNTSYAKKNILTANLQFVYIFPGAESETEGR